MSRPSITHHNKVERKILEKKIPFASSKDQIRDQFTILATVQQRIDGSSMNTNNKKMEGTLATLCVTLLNCIETHSSALQSTSRRYGTGGTAIGVRHIEWGSSVEREKI